MIRGRTLDRRVSMASREALLITAEDQMISQWLTTWGMASLTRSVEVVSVILRMTVSVHDISINGMITERPSSVGDRVWRREEISARQAELRTRAATALSNRLEIFGEPRNLTGWGADWWRCWREVVFLGVKGRVFTRVWTEVGGFVHVDPETVDVDAVIRAEEACKLVVPPGLGLRVKPVGIDGHSRPDGAYYIRRGSN